MNPKGSKTFLEPLDSIEDIIAIIEELAKEDRARGGQPACPIFTIGVFCGFRIGDILELKIGNVCDKGKRIKTTIRIREQKRGKPIERTVPDIARKILKEYIDSLDWSKVKYQSYLFESTRRAGHPYTCAWFSQRLKLAAAVCGIEQRVASHTMRKTFARLAYDTNRQNHSAYPTEYSALESVSKMIGHSTTATTERYIGLDKERERETISGINHHFVGRI